MADDAAALALHIAVEANEGVGEGRIDHCQENFESPRSRCNLVCTFVPTGICVPRHSRTGADVSFTQQYWGRQGTKQTVAFRRGFRSISAHNLLVSALASRILALAAFALTIWQV